MSAANEDRTATLSAHSGDSGNEPEHELSSLSTTTAPNDHSTGEDPEESGHNQVSNSYVHYSQARGSKLNKIGFWIGIGVGVAALVVAIYYGFWSLQMQKWQAKNDYRDSCMTYMVWNP